ncbi:hypothetical protein WJX72_009338 [[Myrmecia] bisecta]|uniref:DNA/RNA-binding protein Alba-like domain-containing protein n=1 Tax=[Myrmecia] bisecta TaxID=41462 RepID=A0AAW1PWW0_9CHLO
MEQQQHPARIQVSNTKKPVFFYVNLAKRFLQEHGEVQLSALGLAIPTMVTVAEILKHGQLAVEKKLFTSLDAVADDGRERAGLHNMHNTQTGLQVVPTCHNIAAGQTEKTCN